MTHNKKYVVIILLAMIFITFSCKKDVPTTEPEPEEEEERPEITSFTPHSRVALFDLTTKKDPLDDARNLYSAQHILRISGVPFFETSDMSTATGASLIQIGRASCRERV